MKKIFILLFLFFFAASAAAYAFCRAGNTYTPDVDYTQPRDDSETDLTGKDNLVFEWRAVPIPAGGREKYRFEIFEESENGSDRIYITDLEPDIFSVDVPVNMFKSGMQYTWRVRQRDEISSNWSTGGEMWRFTARKSGGATSPAVPAASDETK
ncbi:MAG: hypothetical protein PHI59_10125 [Candidatus Omnitrophica bacterium]|nr:hypothetical protein [Candidatus Omnitrophota bacterium]